MYLYYFPEIEKIVEHDKYIGEIIKFENLETGLILLTGFYIGVL